MPNDTCNLEPIQLRGFPPIDHPLDFIVMFTRMDRSYFAYDRAHVNVNVAPSPDEVRLANKMGARMSAKEVDDLTGTQGAIESALIMIPPSASILDSEEALPWPELHTLFTRTLRKGIGISRATKILHKKRPNLIPVLDDLVATYIREEEANEGRRIARSSTAAIAVDLLKGFRREVHYASNARALSELRVALENRSINLTECRIMDIFIWVLMNERRNAEEAARAE